ncbi:MAG TPA: NADH-quinone oxidoreductase subunit C, partial [Planctomycetota bacterium]|nr:NADH-quinone oxidoreductase subunit C [Planctomycetota bacterium]
HGKDPSFVESTTEPQTIRSWRDLHIDVVEPIKVEAGRTLRQKPAAVSLSQRFADWGADAQSVAAAINARFGESAASYQAQRLDSYVAVDASQIATVVRFLADEPMLKFNVLANLSGVDLGDKGLAVVYHLESWPEKRRVILRAVLPRENPRIPSITAIHPAANWNERELYDMFGIAVPGHPDWNEDEPDAMRILCEHGWSGFPLRKDYVWPESFNGIPLRRPPLDPRKGIWVNLARCAVDEQCAVEKKAIQSSQPEPSVPGAGKPLAVPKAPAAKVPVPPKTPAPPNIPPPPPHEPAAAAPEDEPEKNVQPPAFAPAHVAEPENFATPAAIGAAPHMAEREPMTSAEMMTVDSPEGRSTVLVERTPGHGTHATVVDEKDREKGDEKTSTLRTDVPGGDASEAVRRGQASAAPKPAEDKPRDEDRPATPAAPERK